MPDKLSSPTSAIVLLSSGLDSAFNLLKTTQQFKVALALTFDYGQRACAREVECSTKLAAHFNVPHKVVQLPWFKDFTKTTLVDRSLNLPTGSDVKIDSIERSLETAKAVWVPNRNGIFLNIAAGFAEGLSAQYIVPGFNLEEAQTFPDNSGAYLKSLDEAFAFSTQNRVHTHCYSTHLNKSQIVKQAMLLDLPFKLLWPCYQDGAKWCGTCESCLRFARALESNGLNLRSLQ